MNKSHALILACLSLFLLAGFVSADQATAEKPKTGEMHMYHIVLAKAGPNWKSQGSQEGMDIRMRAISNIKKATEEGLIISAGLVNDETDVEFIFILDVETKTEAFKLINQAENFKNGFFTAEIYSYFAPKNLVAGQYTEAGHGK
jgi:hypothetical protein